MPVVLRLIDAAGRPEVKIAASVAGGGLSFVGESDATQVKIGADRAESFVSLTAPDAAGDQTMVTTRRRSGELAGVGMPYRRATKS
jgi:hypothetical protein